MKQFRGRADLSARIMLHFRLLSLFRLLDFLFNYEIISLVRFWSYKILFYILVYFSFLKM